MVVSSSQVVVVVSLVSSHVVVVVSLTSSHVVVVVFDAWWFFPPSTPSILFLVRMRMSCISPTSSSATSAEQHREFSVLLQSEHEFESA